MLQIRIATFPDHDSIEALWAEAQLPTVSAEEWEQLIGGVAADVLVAEDDGGLAGAAVASFDGWRAYIYHVAVDPLSRGHGVARALMQHAASHLASRGAREIYVLVHQANEAGLALVTSSGYELADGEIAFRRILPAAVPSPS